jgi:hypothetical protein
MSGARFGFMMGASLSLFALTHALERIAIPWYRLSRQAGRER